MADFPRTICPKSCFEYHLSKSNNFNSLESSYGKIHELETACSTYSGFESKSVSHDAFPPHFLRRKGWTLHAKTPKDFSLGEALGLNAALVSCPPAFEFPIDNKASAHVAVGKWYVPFMFMKESGRSLKEQMKKSMYCEMILEQRWERIFESENMGGETTVAVDATVVAEVVLLDGRVAAGGYATEGVMWYQTSGDSGAGNVGLSLGIVDRMKWEQKSTGWDENGGKIRKVKSVEEFGERWIRFQFYVVAERFALKRMDGCVVLAFDFYHTHRTRSKWA